MYDYHLHSSISADSQESMEDMCRASLAAGLKEICFTEHADIDFPFYMDYLCDLDAYDRAYAGVKDRFPGLVVRQGLEVGLEPHTISRMKKLLCVRQYDFIVLSQHIVNGEDPYTQAYFAGKTRKEAFERYFEALYYCQSRYDDYSVIGHLGIPSRFCPYEEKRIAYADYPDLIDAILKTAIDKGKGLELNTTGLPATGEVLPSRSILRRYRELKGEILTVGSDAHSRERVGEGIGRALDCMRALGFRYVCTYDRMRCIYNKL